MEEIKTEIQDANDFNADEDLLMEQLFEVKEEELSLLNTSIEISDYEMETDNEEDYDPVNENIEDSKMETIRSCSVVLAHVDGQTGERPEDSKTRYFCKYHDEVSYVQIVTKKNGTSVLKTIYRCPYCAFESQCEKNLKKHIPSHAKGKSYKRPRYEHTTAKTNNLILRLQNNTGEKPYPCPDCKYATKYRSQLQRHIQIHTGEKPYQCSYCKYTGARKDYLIRHLNIHLGKKLYQCSHCEYSTLLKSLLQRHLKTHTGKKLYRCPYCKYAADCRSQLQRHIRIHTGEKPYQCSHCKYAAARKDNLIHHLQTHMKKALSMPSPNMQQL